MSLIHPRSMGLLSLRSRKHRLHCCAFEPVRPPKQILNLLHIPITEGAARGGVDRTVAGSCVCMYSFIASHASMVHTPYTVSCEWSRCGKRTRRAAVVIISIQEGVSAGRRLDKPPLLSTAVLPTLLPLSPMVVHSHSDSSTLPDETEFDVLSKRAVIVVKLSAVQI